MIKALFFDVDGTLVSFKTHRIPQSTVDALTEAKRRGAGIYISTGRPKRLINNLDEISHLVDGYITATGAYCTVGGDVVSCITIPDDEARAFVRKSDEMRFATQLGRRRARPGHNTVHADNRHRHRTGADANDEALRIGALVSRLR